MSLTSILDRIREAPEMARIAAWATDAGPTPRSLELRGTAGSTPAFILHLLARDRPAPLVCVLTSDEEAAYLFSDLDQLGRTDADLLRFPPTGHKPFDTEQITDPASLVQRGDVLQQLREGWSGLLVTSVEALAELVPPPSALERDTLTVSTGEVHELGPLVERLVAQGFERVEFVEQPGELAVRGGILDVYSYTGDYPIRIEFFGDDVDSIREFDPRTQRSISRLSTARLVPNLEREEHGSPEAFASLFDYLPPATLLSIFDETRALDAAREQFGAAEKARAHALEEHPDHTFPDVAARYLDRDRLEIGFLGYDRLLFGHFTEGVADARVDLHGRPQPSFNASIDVLRRQIVRNTTAGADTLILCDSRGQESRLRELLGEPGEGLRFELRVESLHEGFELPHLHLAVYTDHQIFNRYHRPTARKRRKRSGGLTARDLQSLQPGDFVVHVDYGIGKFAGMQKIEVRGKQQEAVRVLFADQDTLYVNVNALYKLHKYSGKEGHQPRLTKLGSGQWERTKAKTKKRVKDIARDLIKLYAKRKESRGHAFSPDSIWQRELEASFQFEDTPDQAATTEAVKADMEQPVPMDRLVCGDVGFGKTEIAVRAAFKAVQDGKQAAILVPTTILAQQHYETFAERLKNFPVRVEVVSRFRSTQETKDVIAAAKAGEVDVLIGTHRLASKDVGFKDLGLLVVDEEQRFGVSTKERLRQMRAEVDTLTLTATPIPRTLQFSLLGARDLSIISTPPPNRQPIVTEIHTFDRDLVRDAIVYETSRGGQVFFVHNRVKSIDETADMLRALVPNVRFRVAHGQMKPTDLEAVMVDFMDHKFDVLVSTNIVESGLDISNVNTILINHAERFGIAELHQLRGRVGRSNQKAFCYLLVPSVHTLTREARQRLQAVEEFSELGSGFNIAMRDMDIRGAGNLLGAEQSGFIEDVGFETYHKILDEAVQELRSEEFQGLFENAPVPRPGETQVDVEEDAYLPEDYIENNVERLNLYRRISEAEADEELESLRVEFVDRFGPIPAEVDNLLLAAELKGLAQVLRLPKVTFKNERLFLEMPSQKADPYFYEHLFHPLLERLGNLDRRYVLKDTKTKLRCIVQNVPDLAAAKAVMDRLVPAELAAAAR